MADARLQADLSLVHLRREPSVREGAPPLLILLHGVGSNERSMSSRWSVFDPRFLVLSARSPIALGPDSFAWFHVSFTPSGSVIDRDEAAAGWAHVARFVDEAIEAYGADPAHVYLAGFSQGAIMALAALLTAPAHIAGVVAMSGRLLPEVLPYVAPPPALRDKPVLVVHGTRDEKLGIHYARAAREGLARFPLRLDYRELDMGHAMTPESLDLAAGWLRARLDEPVEARR